MADKLKKLKEKKDKVDKKLFLAIEKGEVKKVEKILKNKLADINTTRSGVHVEVGHYEDRRDYDVWVDEGSYYTKETPLSVAIDTGNQDMIYMLSSRGAEVDEEHMRKQKVEKSKLPYTKQAQVLKMVYNMGKITNNEVARRACILVNDHRTEAEEDNLINFLLSHIDFNMRDMNGNEFLMTAFRFGRAADVLERKDLKLGKAGSLELAQAAIKRGTPQELADLFSRPDLEFGYYVNSYTRNQDGIALFNELAEKAKKNSEYYDALYALVNNPTFSLSFSGREALSRSLDFEDKRIFSTLSKRGDIIESLMESGDSEMVKSLLSRKGVDINYKNGELLEVAARKKKLDPDIATMIMEYKGYNASEAVLNYSIKAAARNENYIVLEDILANYPLPLDAINDAVIMVGKDGNYALVQKILKTNPQVLTAVKSGELLNACIASDPEQKDLDISEYVETLRMIMNRSEYNVTKDSNLKSTIQKAAPIQEAFAVIIGKQGVSYAEHGYTILESAIKQGYSAITEDLIARSDVTIGANFQKLLKLSDEKFKETPISAKLMEKREREMEELPTEKN